MEKSEANQEKVDVEKEAEVKLKSTVVDIDRVRETKVQEENLWLLEAAEQDGELMHRNIIVCFPFSIFMLAFV